jgi:hypothetical protein
MASVQGKVATTVAGVAASPLTGPCPEIALFCPVVSRDGRSPPGGCSGPGGLEARLLLLRAHAGGHQEVVATDLPLGMPQPGPRLGRRASLLAEAAGSVVMGCDGDGSIRRLRRG